MPKEEKEFDPNQTIVSKITHSKHRSLMYWLTGLGTVGAALIALNAFTGLNLRPAWGFEVEQLAAADVTTKQKLERVMELQDTTADTITELRKGQLEIRVHQIDREKRELRRELAGHQQRAEEYRQREQPVPGWLLTSITDTESALRELDEERERVEARIRALAQ